MQIASLSSFAFAAAIGLSELGASAQVSPALDHLAGPWPFDPVTPLVPSDIEPGMRFGADVALSGAFAAVAAPGAAPFGAAYVFEKQGNQWVEVARLESGESVDEGFGSSVSISGARVVVGAWGAAYVFTQLHGTWIRTARLTSPDGPPGDAFGLEVATDGSRIAIGARFAVDVYGIEGGAAYVFEANGTVWPYTAKLDISGAAYGGDSFSQSLALHGDTLVGGAPLMKVAGHDYGRALAFAGVGNQWVHQAYLDPTAESFAFLEAGIAVALDGDLAVVGAPGDGPGSGYDVTGAAYVYRRSGTSWTLEAKLAANDELFVDELFDTARFGTAVAARGSTILVGAAGGDVDGGPTGSVYVFEKTRIGWVQTDEWAAVTGNFWCAQVALGDGFALVGTQGSDSAGRNSGAAVIRILPRRLAPLAVSPSHVQFWQDTPGGSAGDIDGSQQRLLLDATRSNAGGSFVVLGSMSGTEPGTVIGGYLVPLVADAYLSDTFHDPSSTPLVGSVGVLDAHGRAVARFVVPPGGFDPSLAGTTFHHAFVVLDPATQSVVFASNAAPVTLVY